MTDPDNPTVAELQAAIDGPPTAATRLSRLAARLVDTLEAFDEVQPGDFDTAGEPLAQSIPAMATTLVTCLSLMQARLTEV